MDVTALDLCDLPRDDRTEEPIYIWRRAFGAALEQDMLAPAWPLSVLETLPEPKGWVWSLAPRDAEQPPTWDELVGQVKRAAGIGGPIQGNVVATLLLRTYDDRDSRIGDRDWWFQHGDRVVKGSSFGERFFGALMNILERADQAGWDLAVEQISIVLSKDPKQPSSTLAPTLHSDLGYGHLESVIASVIEPGFDEMGGVLFVPGRRMDELEAIAPITLSTLRTKLAHEPVMVTGSGDVIVYSGMIGADGIRARQNGIPHISPDRPGKSARLALLMRRRGRKS